MKVKQGDWISFVRDNRVMYGRVLYKRRGSLATYLVTDHGEVDEDDALERRGADGTATIARPVD